MMIKKSLVGIILLTLMLLPCTSSQEANTYHQPANQMLYVGGSGPGNYSQIQHAINNATPGDTIFVYTGTYIEHILITKTIHLIGEQKEHTIIDGNKSNQYNIITIHATGCTINSFTLQNTSSTINGIQITNTQKPIQIENCIIHNTFKGIQIRNSTNVTTINCTIFDNEEGIYLVNAHSCQLHHCQLQNRQRGISINDQSTQNQISNCTITGNKTDSFIGIDIHDNNNLIRDCRIFNERSGIYIKSDNNILINNSIDHNLCAGIIILGNNNQITNTIIENNGHSDEYGFYGIEIFDGSHNMINHCDINNNGCGGIAFFDLPTHNTITNSTISNNGYNPISSLPRAGIVSDTENYIYRNTIINNYIQAYDRGQNSHWDDGTLGNFWSDHITKDLNGDKIGDTPKTLYQDSNKDKKPLLVPYNHNQPGIIILRPKPFNQHYIYLRNIPLLPADKTILIGNIKIKTNAITYTDTQIQRVEFLVDNKLRHTDYHPPYTWNWKISNIFNTEHTLKVIAHDEAGKTAIHTKTVQKFL